PPIAYLTFFIKATALVIVAMADFVADDDTNRAVIYCRVGVVIEKGWLQYAGGKGNLVEHGHIGCVDALRWHLPQAAVNRAFELLYFALPHKFFHAQYVAEQVVGGNIQARVIWPLFRIANTHFKGREFFQGLAARGFIHPAVLL